MLVSLSPLYYPDTMVNPDTCLGNRLIRVKHVLDDFFLNYAKVYDFLLVLFTPDFLRTKLFLESTGYFSSN